MPASNANSSPQFNALQGRKEGINAQLQAYKAGQDAEYLNKSVNPREFLREKTEEAYKEITGLLTPTTDELLNKEEIIARLQLVCDYRLGVYSKKVTFKNEEKEGKEEILIIRDARRQEECIKNGLDPYKNFGDSYLGMIVNQFRAAEEIIDISEASDAQKAALKKQLDAQLRGILGSAVNLLQADHITPEKAEEQLSTLNRAVTGLLADSLYEGLPNERESDKKGVKVRPNQTEWGNRLNKAKDYANFRDDHGSIATFISVTERDSDPDKNIDAESVEIAVKMSEITEEQETLINDFKNQRWYQELPEYEKLLVLKNLPKVLSGDKVIPTQIKSFPLLRNGWLSVVKCTDHIVDTNKEETLFEKVRSGAPVRVIGKPVRILPNFFSKQAREDLEASTTASVGILEQIREFFNSGSTPKQLHVTSLNRGGSKIRIGENGIVETLKAAIANINKSENKDAVAFTHLGINWAAKAPSGKITPTLAERLTSNIVVFQRRKKFINIAVSKSLELDQTEEEIDASSCKSGKDRTGAYMYAKTAMAIKNFLSRGKTDKKFLKKLEERIEDAIAYGGHAQYLCGSWGGTLFCSALKPVPYKSLKSADPYVPPRLHPILFQQGIGRANNLKVKKKNMLGKKVEKTEEDYDREKKAVQTFIDGTEISKEIVKEINPDPDPDSEPTLKPQLVEFNIGSKPRSFVAMVMAEEQEEAEKAADIFIKVRTSEIYQEFHEKYGLTPAQFKLFLHLADSAAEFNNGKGQKGFKFFLADKLSQLGLGETNKGFLSTLMSGYKGSDKEQLIKQCVEKTDLAGAKDKTKADKYFAHIDNKGRKQKEPVADEQRLFTEDMLDDLTPEQKNFCHIMMVLSAKLQNLSKDEEKIEIRKKGSTSLTLARSHYIASHLLKDKDFIRDPANYTPPIERSR